MHKIRGLIPFLILAFTACAPAIQAGDPRIAPNRAEAEATVAAAKAGVAIAAERQATAAAIPTQTAIAHVQATAAAEAEQQRVAAEAATAMYLGVLEEAAQATASALRFEQTATPEAHRVEMQERMAAVDSTVAALPAIAASAEAQATAIIAAAESQATQNWIGSCFVGMLAVIVIVVLIVVAYHVYQSASYSIATRDAELRKVEAEVEAMLLDAAQKQIVFLPGNQGIILLEHDENDRIRPRWLPPADGNGKEVEPPNRYAPPEDPKTHEFALYLLVESKRKNGKDARRILPMRHFPTTYHHSWRLAIEYLEQWGVKGEGFEGTDVGPYYDSLARLHMGVMKREVPPLPRLAIFPPTLTQHSGAQ